MSAPLSSILILQDPYSLLTPLLAALGGIMVMLSWTLVRGAVIRYRIRRYESLSFQIHAQWQDILKGTIPAAQWRNDRTTRHIVQSIVIQQIRASVPPEVQRLQNFLRANGLVDACRARSHSGNACARRQALLSLGAMRVPEAIGTLSGALDDRQLQTRMAAVRGLGSTGLSQAAEPIIEALMVGELRVPRAPVFHALSHCFAGRPEALLPYLRRARGETREILASVASELVTREVADEMIVLAGDALPQVRACAARALAWASLPLALPALANLARDEVWFVRLRAIMALNEIHHPRTIPTLLEAVRDSNRLVRLRAAAALSQFEDDRIAILSNVVESRDLYALHATISALELCGGFKKAMEELSDPARHDETAERLLGVLREAAAALWATRPADPVVETVFP